MFVSQGVSLYLCAFASAFHRFTSFASLVQTLDVTGPKNAVFGSESGDVAPVTPLQR